MQKQKNQGAATDIKGAVVLSLPSNAAWTLLFRDCVLALAADAAPPPPPPPDDGGLEVKPMLMIAGEWWNGAGGGGLVFRTLGLWFCVLATTRELGAAAGTPLRRAGDRRRWWGGCGGCSGDDGREHTARGSRRAA